MQYSTGYTASQLDFVREVLAIIVHSFISLYILYAHACMRDPIAYVRVRAPMYYALVEYSR